MITKSRNALGHWYILVILGLFSTASTLAQEKDYKIGPEDVLEIRFWQEERVNSTVRVGQDGRITLDIIGQIEAEGRTTTELETEIVRLMSRLNKNISQVVVSVKEYNFNYVFLTGQIKQPGKKSFEQIPDLWTLINEAGGPTEIGDLSRVTIIRGGTDAGKVEIVNVSAAITSGQLSKLPKVRREDTIEIPRTPGGLNAADISASLELKNVIYVVGAVNKPGWVEYEPNLDILEVLAKAGGERVDADLKKVTVVTKDGMYGQSYQYNLDKYRKSGRPARYVLRKEDTFIVPAKKTGFLGLRGDIASVTALITTFSAIVLLVDRNNN